MSINVKNDKETVMEDITLDIDIETVRALASSI